MLQLLELCRLCAQKKRNKLDLFTGLTSEETKILLSKISICLSVEVSREDMLPKSICLDCQKAVEQFNAFRQKCLKADEKLHKMLSLALPSKLTVIRIKEEHLETDFHENNNASKFNESVSNINLISLKNVKAEVEEEEEVEVPNNLGNEFGTPDLIQIISEEIVSQQFEYDIKQPQIEIISENFNYQLKNVSNCRVEYNNENIKNFDIKLLPEELRLSENNINSVLSEVNSENPEIPPINFIQVKEQFFDSDKESIAEEMLSLEKRKVVTHPTKNQNANQESNKIDNPISKSNEIDDKYLTLQDGEVCDIDMEEIAATIKKKQDPNAKFPCDKCNKIFKFFKSLRKHKHWHDSQPDIFICDICKTNKSKNFEFSNLKCLTIHMQRKHSTSNKNTYSCNSCQKHFISQGQLNAHCRKVHDKSGASCLKCGKKFKNRVCLNYHLKVHQEERPYVCDLCGKSFKWNTALRVHIQWHKQEKNFLCSKCGKKFTAKKNLIEHLNIHSGKRPFVCAHCTASFTQLSAYSKHLYLHNSDKKSHKCDKCSKTFSHAYLLKQHLLRHSGIRPYECPTCRLTFKSQSDLWSHTKSHSEKQYGCKICGRKFALSKTLKDHMVLHTGIKHLCPVSGCGKTYTQRFSLTKHFSNQHPTLTIVSKKSGRKAPVTENLYPETKVDYIRYEFKEKIAKESLIIY